MNLEDYVKEKKAPPMPDNFRAINLLRENAWGWDEIARLTPADVEIFDEDFIIFYRTHTNQKNAKMHFYSLEEEKNQKLLDLLVKLSENKDKNEILFENLSGVKNG